LALVSHSQIIDLGLPLLEIFGSRCGIGIRMSGHVLTYGIIRFSALIDQPLTSSLFLHPD
jgi:hypothetical protein